MNFNKIPPAINFRYQCEGKPLLSSESKNYEASVKPLGGGVFHYRVHAAKWSQKSQATLSPEAFSGKATEAGVELAADGSLQIHLKGKTLIHSFEGREFGILGNKWNLSFTYDEAMRFYGLGEKNTSLEKSGQVTKFWNTDALFDFGFTRVEREATDPLYASIPYVLIQQTSGCVGILVDNPYPVFMNMGAKENIANLLDAKEAEPQCVSIGSYDGQPDIYFIVGASVQDVTRKLQTLTGRTPLPPLWALGYHQCRFGYRDLTDLEELDEKFDALEIPCDGLWLDIDYMDSFKVFTVEAEGFDRHEVRIARLQAKGRKIVPIIDPGVKNHPDFAIFQSGLTADVFCKTSEGEIYSGFVWPGRTAFPDFSLPKVREWWAQQVEAFTREFNFDGYWIDMNDPSTGSSELEDMLFNNGQDSHDSYHNQYALGMQEGTVEGLRRAIGEKRSFIISRSGYTSSQRHSAIWTGDNWSNYFHLREGIAMSLNLSLSGVPFNGPDVPGFAGEATPELAVDWHKAGFLFPFFRNHSANISPKQEPWQFDEPYRNSIIHFIRLRYKLLPYLYNLFHQHAETGDPYLRPLFYQFPEDPSLDRIGDQFMVGTDIMQAPIVHEGETQRVLYLPGDDNWFDSGSGRWHKGRQKQNLNTNLSNTGLYFKEGALIPMLPGERLSPEKDLSDIEIHVFLKADSTVKARSVYCFDDGETVDAKTSRVTLEAEVIDSSLHIRIAELDIHEPSIRLVFMTYEDFELVQLYKDDEVTTLQSQSAEFNFNGTKLQARQSESVLLEPTTATVSPLFAV